MYVCMFILLNRYMSFSFLFLFFLSKNGYVLAFINFVPFRSVPQNIIIHTDNYIQRNGTEQEYPELLAGLHDIHGTGEGIL